MRIFPKANVDAPWICTLFYLFGILFVSTLGKPSSIQQRQSCSGREKKKKKNSIPIKTEKPGLFSLATKQKPKSPIWVLETDHENKGLLYLQIRCQKETNFSLLIPPSAAASFLTLEMIQCNLLPRNISHRLVLECLFGS